MIASWSTRLNVERLNQGMPLIAADPSGWDNGFTLNPTAIHLEKSLQNSTIIEGMLGRDALDDPRLREGSSRRFLPGHTAAETGTSHSRSSVGLAVFTPEMELLKRFDRPVITPTDDPMGCDFSGVEDQRITRIGDTFYMVYCGYNPRMSCWHNIHICMAESKDLINWTKLGRVGGSVYYVPNKDAVLFPEPVNGCYMMLHRPCIGNQDTLSISLAISESPTGDWQDLGAIMPADQRLALQCFVGRRRLRADSPWEQPLPRGLPHGELLCHRRAGLFRELRGP